MATRAIDEMKKRMERLKGVRASGGGYNWFKSGNYRVRVQSIKMGYSVKPGKIGSEFLAVTGTITKSDSLDPTMAVGKVVDWSTGADKAPYEGNVKQVFCALWGETEQGYDAADAETLALMFSGTVEVGQVTTGRLVEAAVQNVLTKNKTDFTAVRWSAVPEEEQDVMVDAMLDGLDK